jgi:hypothetical protein
MYRKREKEREFTMKKKNEARNQHKMPLIAAVVDLLLCR